MKLEQASRATIGRALRGRGLGLQIGPFATRIGCNQPGLADTLHLLYGGFETLPPDAFIDIRVKVRRPRTLRSLLRPRVEFEGDIPDPFNPLPADYAFPMLEWGINWAVATQAHHYLMLHAAVIARDDRAMIFPALPGSGKSTLCAALVHRGWRLLSDEFGLIRPGSLEVEPMPRPIPLKNDSIELIQQFAPDAVLGPHYPETRKGRIAHVRPPASALGGHARPARIAWLVFPQYRRGAEPRLHPFPRGRAFLKVAGNSFNYKLQGAEGFRTLAALVDRVAPQYFEFDDLEGAVQALDAFTAATPD